MHKKSIGYIQLIDKNSSSKLLAIQEKTNILLPEAFLLSTNIVQAEKEAKITGYHILMLNLLHLHVQNVSMEESRDGFEKPCDG